MKSPIASVSYFETEKNSSSELSQIENPIVEATFTWQLLSAP